MGRWGYLPVAPVSGGLHLQQGWCQVTDRGLKSAGLLPGSDVYVFHRFTGRLWQRGAETKSQNTLGFTPCAEVSRPATRGSGGAGLRTGLNPGNRAASGSGLAPGWRACYWRHGLWLSESLGMWAWIQVGAHLSARLYLLSLLAGAQACLFRTVSIVGFSALWFLKLP